jgi:hypothetical protein
MKSTSEENNIKIEAGCLFARFLPEITESTLIERYIFHLYQNLLFQIIFVPYLLHTVDILHEVQVEIYNFSH